MKAAEIRNMSATELETKLTELKSRSGDDLEIHETDKVTVSYVQAGKTYTTSFKITADSTLQDIFTAAENIDDKSKIFASSYGKSCGSRICK